MAEDSKQDVVPKNLVGSPKNGNFTWLLPMYIFLYSFLGIWLLIDGWLTNFSSILQLWAIDDAKSISNVVRNLLFTMIGALIGSSILGIISFHRYFAVEKSFDRDHLWGFWFSPLLALLVGILMFAIIQSGLVVLTGDLASTKSPENASLGYLALGGIAGYNWDVFVKKLQNLSKDMINSAQ